MQYTIHHSRSKGPELSLAESFIMIGEQAIWALVLILIGKIFWKASERIITVNGG